MNNKEYVLHEEYIKILLIFVWTKWTVEWENKNEGNEPWCRFVGGVKCKFGITRAD